MKNINHSIYNPFYQDKKYLVAVRKLKEVVKRSNNGYVTKINNITKINLFKKVSKRCSDKEEFKFHLVHDFIITPTMLQNVFRFFYVDRNNFRPCYFEIEDTYDEIKKFLILMGIFRIRKGTTVPYYNTYQTLNLFFILKRDNDGLHIKNIHQIPFGKNSRQNVKHGKYFDSITNKLYNINTLEYMNTINLWIEFTQEYPKHMAKYHEFLYSAKKYPLRRYSII